MVSKYCYIEFLIFGVTMILVRTHRRDAKNAKVARRIQQRAPSTRTRTHQSDYSRCNRRGHRSPSRAWTRVTRVSISRVSLPGTASARNPVRASGPVTARISRYSPRMRISSGYSGRPIGCYRSKISRSYRTNSRSTTPDLFTTRGLECWATDEFQCGCTEGRHSEKSSRPERVILCAFFAFSASLR